MKNAALLLGLLLFAVGCGQVAENSSPSATPAGAKMISLSLPGMT